MPPAYPSPMQFVVYFAITDGLGKHTIELRLVNANQLIDESVEPVFATKTKINIEDPLGVLEIPVGIQFMLAEPGVYHCELLCNGNVLMSRRVIASEAPQNKNESESNDS